MIEAQSIGQERRTIPILFPLLAALLLASSLGRAQTVLTSVDPSEKPGARPYEMVWAHRTEPAPPSLAFSDLAGWSMRVEGGEEATFRPSRAQDLWGRAVGELRYRAAPAAASAGAAPSASPRLSLIPPAPIPAPAGANSVDFWVYGNRWSYVNPPDTPPVTITLHLTDGIGQDRSLDMGEVGWEQWWLMHQKLPPDWKPPLRLARIEVSGGRQPDWRSIFFDSLRFYKEPLPPLHFDPQPRRNLTLFAGQSPGANTGPGRLRFPTREETILPHQLDGPFHDEVMRDTRGGFLFTYAGGDERLSYRFEPAAGLGSLVALVDGKTVGRLMDGASVSVEGAASAASAGPRLQAASLSAGVLNARYADGTLLSLRLWQKSLVIDVINRTGRAAGLQFGQMAGLRDPRLVEVPYLQFPRILLSRAGDRPVFTSLLLDWYRSNGSEPYAAEELGVDTARINGGVRYTPLTNGRRNPLFERLFLTVSPTFEEVLPAIPNPAGSHAREAASRLWQESWGPANYADEEKRSQMLRAYGIRDLIQCNHEIAWRDNGESFTLRIHAAPGKGGDASLEQYVRSQESLGWLSGLYTNYCDFAPVNEHWNPDWVQRTPDGSWRPAWPRNWALKPVAAVQLDALLAPQIEARYHSNSAYTDVQTAVAPWDYTDFDARVPGAGTFAQTFYSYGQLLQNDSRVYGGPVFSEGTWQWMYAGLDDGNYGVCYGARPWVQQPLLPSFVLREIHTRECDIGMGWTTYFCDPIPDWNSPANLDRSIDRFLLYTLAYGHIGWLVEEQYGMSRTCRSYYMLQQVQARFGLQPPSRVAYWDGHSLRSVSEALVLGLPDHRRQLFVEYPNGLSLWLNDSPSDDWPIQVAGRNLILPPAGWAAWQPGPEGVLSFSAALGSGKVDYLHSPAYTYLDGRGQWLQTAEGASNGALAILPRDGGLDLIHISGDGPFEVTRPYGARGSVVSCQARGADGKLLGAAIIHDSGAATWIEPVPGALRYTLKFSGLPEWSLEPAALEAAPGSWVALHASGISAAAGSEAPISPGSVLIPAATPVDTWLGIRVSAGVQGRELWIRAVPAVRWHWSARQQEGAELLTLAPYLPGCSASASRVPVWARPVPQAALPAAGERLQPGSVVGKIAATVTPPAGWSVKRAISSTAFSTPQATTFFDIQSSLPAGATGTLEISTGLSGDRPLRLQLSRVEQEPDLLDLSAQPMSWGIDRRGQAETRQTEGSGAIFNPHAELVVGGLSRPGIFMHPPYNGGVGYTWAETGPIRLPEEPCRFHCWIGIQDGGDPSDGVLFEVQLVDSKGSVHPIASEMGYQRHWKEMQAEIAGFEGQQVRLKLVADVGPHDNSTADWGAWGEPSLLLGQPGVVTRIAPIQ